jgi:hypothetical protein
MSSRRSWLPREGKLQNKWAHTSPHLWKSHKANAFIGFTLDVVQSIVSNTVLNPYITLPLWLLTRYNDRARGLSLDHPLAASRLKFLAYLGIARAVNGWLNQGALNNWTKAKFDWNKELVLITGGSDGFGRLLTLKFAEKNTKVIILDVQEPKFDLREFC